MSTFRDEAARRDAAMGEQERAVAANRDQVRAAIEEFLHEMDRLGNPGCRTVPLVEMRERRRQISEGWLMRRTREVIDLAPTPAGSLTGWALAGNGSEMAILDDGRVLSVSGSSGYTQLTWDAIPSADTYHTRELGIDHHLLDDATEIISRLIETYRVNRGKIGG